MNTLVGGGRYDGLMQEIGGQSTPGVGYGMGIERVIANIKRQELQVPDDTGTKVLVAHMGEAAKLPMRCRITLPPENRRPQSTDPEISDQWSLPRKAEGYDRVIASWRAQRPRAVVRDLAIEREPVQDESEDD